jgi:hypothetical protein
MHVSMPPDTPPPDDARRPSASSSSEGGNVVDPEVLAERRAQRAEQAEQSAARRAADAQVLAAQLARERTRLEAERDAARAEAAAAREGADAAIAEARHLQAERDTLRDVLAAARRERDALAAERSAAPIPVAPEPPAPAAAAPEEPAPVYPKPASSVTNGAARNGHAAPPAAWASALRRELAVARTATRISAPVAGPAAPVAPVPALARNRRQVTHRAAAGPVPAAKPLTGGEGQRRGDRAAPITALALERERSSRLQAQLDSSLAVQRELRTHIAALQRAVHQRVEAERRIETALRRLREDLTAANSLRVERTVPATPAPAPAVASAAESPETTPAGPPRAAAGCAAPAMTPTPPAPTTAAPVSVEVAAEPLAAQAEPTAQATPAPEAAPVPQATPAPEATAPAAAPIPAGLDPLRLSAARERLRAAAPTAPKLDPLPVGPPAPWLTAALQSLLATEPDTAGRLVVGLLPAQGVGAERPLRCDLLLAGRGCLAVDVEPGAPASIVSRPAPRPRSARDLSISGDAAGLARLLHGRRTLLRRPARVRGARKALRELRRLAQAPLGLRELGGTGVALEPALALRLIALAIDPAATQGERFAIAHRPLAGGPVDAWLRIADGAPPAVVTSAPSEPTRLTLRCTRGALLALIAGVDPPPGEAGTLDGDDAALALLRSWIARTEHPHSIRPA